ncbi:hypothetical protein SAY86_021375 [Trapa natans]|uniref:Tetrahydrofolate dehydrogenase/cyclohydrolase NAD(P)-binding domain-containing protein n=1 Tax=Trapa natans TaxID=22666 RepID=A0AAN7MZ02_TRANT|nr:hypothetical protein SAY86_021375 [Trapa natans]
MYAAEAGIGTFESSRCPGSRRALGNEKNVREKKRVEWKLEGQNNYFDDGDVQAKVGKIYAIYKKLLSHVLSGRGSIQLNPRLRLQDKPGAIIIDVGTLPVERVSTDNLLGDVCYEEDVKVAAVITPVPGGVGPVAVSMLLSNTPDAAM